MQDLNPQHLGKTSPEDRAPTVASDLSYLSVAKLKQRLATRYGWQTGAESTLLTCLIAAIDKLLSRQLNAILCHPRFTQLEASWRSLAYLIKQAKQQTIIKIKVLNVSKQLLATDLLKSFEFDQCQLFKRIYSEEFGMPGGEPYGVLIGDYQFSAHPKDIDLLQRIAQIAAAAFSPFVSAAAPELFGIKKFKDFNGQINLNRLFKQQDYIRWLQLRELDEARFVGLVLPEQLVRLPYQRYTHASANFCFTPDPHAYLWGNAAYGYGAILIKAFATYGWLANIRGQKNESSTGGSVPPVMIADSKLHQPGSLLLPVTNALVTDKQEAELSQLGFISLCFRYGQAQSVVYNSPSIQKPKDYDNSVARRNAEISAGLEHLFCACRFAHYLKKIGREKIGSFTTPKECEVFLQQWLLGYTASNSVLTPWLRARYPLQDSQVQVKAVPGKPGSYTAIVHLQPYFQLEQVATTLTLITEFNIQAK